MGLLATTTLYHGKTLIYELICRKSQLLEFLLAARDHIEICKIEDASSLMEMAIDNYASEYNILADIALILPFSVFSCSLETIKKLMDASVYADCEQLLKEVLDVIKASSSITKTDRIELDKHLNRYLTEPLNMTVTNLLSNLSCSSYMISRNQARTRMCALIFYTANDREGAEEEAMKMKDSFSLANFVTHCIKISSISELEDSLLQLLAPSCSVMFVCIMAHGGMGVIMDESGILLPLQDLVNHIQQVIGVYTPMVSL